METEIKNLGEIITGNTPSKKEESFWDSEDICFVKPDGISDEGITLIKDSNEYISENARKKARVVSRDAVFVTCIGSIGKIGIASEGDFAFNQQINAIVPNEKVLPRYLAYNLLFSKPKLEAIANAPVVPIINKTQFGEFTINIEESTDKQEQIINTLDKLSGILSSRKKELEELDNLIKARFVEMFGDPISNNFGWETGKLNKLCPVNKYKGNVELENGKVWVLNLDMIESNTGKILNHVYEDEDKVPSSTIKFDDNCVLYSKLRPYLNKVVVPEKTGYATSEMISMQTDSVDKYFLATLLMQKSFVDFANGTAYGAKMPRASVDAIKDFDLILPPYELQKQFAGFVKQVDKSKVAVQESLREMQMLFDSLMQQYFG